MEGTEQQVVYITGATGRLGTAFSQSIVERGGKIFMVDLNGKKGKQLEAKSRVPSPRWTRNTSQGVLATGHNNNLIHESIR